MHHGRKLTPLIALSLAGSLGVGAASAEASTTTAEFAKHANAICRSSTAKLDAVTKPKDAAGVATYLQRSLDAAAPGVAKLRALPLPTQKRADARRAVSTVGKDITVIRSAIKALKGGADPAATLKHFVKLSDALEKIEDRSWRAVGATVCAQH